MIQIISSKNYLCIACELIGFKSPNILLFDVCLCFKTGSRIGSVMVVNYETD